MQPNVLRLGVLAHRGKAAAITDWQPTAHYLNHFLKDYLQHERRSSSGQNSAWPSAIDDRSVDQLPTTARHTNPPSPAQLPWVASPTASATFHLELLPLDFEEMELAITQGQLDFAILNPSLYITGEVRYGLRRIATLKTRCLDQVCTQFGSVLLCPRDRSGEFPNLQALRGQRLAAVDEFSLGGWQMAWREFREAGLNPYRDLAELVFLGSHDRVLAAVLERQVDVGVLRTGMLERWMASGALEPHSLGVVAEQGRSDRTFPFRRSTQLYPEWPFAASERVPEELAQRVAIALLSLPPSHPAARAASSAGWALPLDYQPVHECFKVLQLPPYQHTLDRLQQTQQQLIHAEKMSSLGQLVAGLAHELNNPTSFIYGNVSHAQQYTTDLLALLAAYAEHYPNPPEAIMAQAELIDLEFVAIDLPKILASMRHGAERIRNLVKSLRTFSHLDESVYKTVDLGSSLDSTLAIFSSRLRGLQGEKTITLVKNYRDLPPVACYPGQLNQVFANLLSNAIDALQARDFTPTQPPKIEISAQVVADHVRITFADNGPGLELETQQRVFDPFFTTKPVGKGTGLGLSTSYQIITELHGGRLSCESRPGCGAVFTIEIPRRFPPLAGAGI